MDAILSEVSHKRKQLASPVDDGQPGASKYMRKGELERAREEREARERQEEERRRKAERELKDKEKVGLARRRWARTCAL